MKKVKLLVLSALILSMSTFCVACSLRNNENESTNEATTTTVHQTDNTTTMESSTTMDGSTTATGDNDGAIGGFGEDVKDGIETIGSGIVNGVEDIKDDMTTR